MLKTHLPYMQRCIALARQAKGMVAPNPLVGSVLVYQDRVIGEGYHQQYGKAHAEVNCLNSVLAADRQFINASTLYVSLEPCSHFGKTPPCTDLIIEMGIKQVIIASLDPFEAVNGSGIEKLKNAGIEVVAGVMAEEAMELNKPFFCFHQKKRPYVILKWAETKDGKIAGISGLERLLISNPFSNYLVQAWRSECQAILVGTKTALLDNPMLTNRSGIGNHPIRLVIDKDLQLPQNLHLFDGSAPTLVFNFLKNERLPNLSYQLVSPENVLEQILKCCYQLGVQSLLVEGGGKLLQSFIDQDLWDEARIIVNNDLTIGNGLQAPILLDYQTSKTEMLATDTIHYLYP